MLDKTLEASACIDRLRAELARIDRAAVERWAEFVFDAWTRGGTAASPSGAGGES